MIMKNGKRPNKSQKIAMTSAELNPNDWLVVKNLDAELHLVNRTNNSIKIISK